MKEFLGFYNYYNTEEQKNKRKQEQEMIYENKLLNQRILNYEKKIKNFDKDLKIAVQAE